MRQKLTSSLIGLVIGILNVALFGVFFQFISADLRVLSIWGLSLFTASGLVGGKWLRNNFWFYVPILITPIFVFYFLFITPELPSLILMPVVFTLGVVLGFYSIGQKQIQYFALIVIASGVIQFILIPGLISRDLAKVGNEPAPEFTFTLVDGKAVSKSDLIGNVVVIDFFGTWCRPCVAELPEIEKVYLEFKENSSVQFFVIDSDQNGDTMEKLKKFILKKKSTLPFGYDTQSRFHKSLGFSGVPCLVIIDKSGVIRLKHEGFNEAEDLAGMLRKTIRDLSK